MAGIAVEVCKFRPGVLALQLRLAGDEIHSLAQRDESSQHDKFGSFETVLAFIEVEQLANVGLLLVKILPVPWHRFAEESDLDTGQRRMTCGVHVMSHDLFLGDAA